MIDRTILGTMVTKLEADKGPFTLFALFKTGPWPNDWDIVVAAPWVEDTFAAYDEVRNALEAVFGVKRPEGFRGITTMKPTDTYSSLEIPLQEILEETGTIRRPIEIRGHKLFGIRRMTRAYIYRARPLKPAPNGSTSGAASGTASSAISGATSGATAQPAPVRVRAARKITPTATVIRSGCRVVARAPE